jgi:hypothetical protein
MPEGATQEVTVQMIEPVAQSMFDCAIDVRRRPILRAKPVRGNDESPTGEK